MPSSSWFSTCRYLISDQSNEITFAYEYRTSSGTVSIVKKIRTGIKKNYNWKNKKACYKIFSEVSLKKFAGFWSSLQRTTTFSRNDISEGKSLFLRWLASDPDPYVMVPGITLLWRVSSLFYIQSPHNTLLNESVSVLQFPSSIIQFRRVWIYGHAFWFIAIPYNLVAFLFICFIIFSSNWIFLFSMVTWMIDTYGNQEQRAKVNRM